MGYTLSATTTFPSRRLQPEASSVDRARNGARGEVHLVRGAETRCPRRWCWPRGGRRWKLTQIFAPDFHISKRTGLAFRSTAAGHLRPASGDAPSIQRRIRTQHRAAISAPLAPLHSGRERWTVVAAVVAKSAADSPVCFGLDRTQRHRMRPRAAFATQRGRPTPISCAA